MLKNTISDLNETLNPKSKTINPNNVSRNSSYQRFLRELIVTVFILVGLVLFLAVVGWYGLSNPHLRWSTLDGESILDREPTIGRGSTFDRESTFDIPDLKDEAPTLPKSNPKPEILKGNTKKRKEVFINWRTIYWGKLSDLIKSEVFYRHKIRLQSSRIQRLPTGSEALQDITNDLREGLRTFERQHSVKIIWSKPNSGCPDVTAQFIDFWDKYSSPTKSVSFLSQSLVDVHPSVSGRPPVED